MPSSYPSPRFPRTTSRTAETAARRSAGSDARYSSTVLALDCMPRVSGRSTRVSSGPDRPDPVATAIHLGGPPRRRPSPLLEHLPGLLHHGGPPHPALELRRVRALLDALPHRLRDPDAPRVEHGDHRPRKPFGEPLGPPFGEPL